MSKARIVQGILTSLALTAIAHAATAEGVNIPQVPANAVPDEGSGETTLQPSEQQGGDYQSEVLSNPAVSDAARATAAINANGGNTAVINQTGRSNTSTVIQNGDDNYASQTQKGKSNDLRVEQHGKRNRSVESQKGDYNHKVKIQNGQKSDETSTESPDTGSSGNP